MYWHRNKFHRKIYCNFMSFSLLFLCVCLFSMTFFLLSVFFCCQFGVFECLVSLVCSSVSTLVQLLAPVPRLIPSWNGESVWRFHVGLCGFPLTPTSSHSPSTCKFVIGACERERLFVSFDELATCPECSLLLAKC